MQDDTFLEGKYNFKSLQEDKQFERLHANAKSIEIILKNI
jgi:hypothetical protein